MKKLCAFIFITGTCVSFNAHAWFFFFIPGSVVSKISDSVTGSEGDNCVGQQAQVGDPIRLPNGAVMTVKSLSGTSARCSDPNLPIRALLELRTSVPASNTSVSTMVAAATTEARIDLPDGWEPGPLTDRLKANGAVLSTTNKTTGSGLLLGSYRRAGITDMATYAKTISAGIVNLLQDGAQSPMTPLTINGVSAWQIEISGKTTARIPITIIPEGTPVTFLLTIYEGSKEIVRLNSWTYTANFSNQKEELQRIANSLTGLALPTTAQTKTESAPNPAQSDAASRLSVLKSLLDKELITKDDYETKKQAILNSM